jgi:serine-type D-Ala-D-Ala carboxypeptidase/endopeptidase (penicillin-binding protein 4)
MRACLSLTALLLLLFAPESRADELATQIEKVINGPDYKQAHWGILVADAKTGKVLYELNADRLFTPASTTKLFTCAAALGTLGPDYRFETPVYRRGELKEGVLAGDLVLVASGDLTFGGRTGKNGKTLFCNGDHTYANSGLGTPELPDADPLGGLKELARQVRESGIKEIQGEVLVDDRLFQRARSSGSGPEVVSPVLVNDNVIDVIVTPGAKPGDPAKVAIRPETSYVSMDAEVWTIKKGERTPTLTIQSVGMNQFTVRGYVLEDAKPAVRIYPVEDLASFARTLFLECLRKQGVKFSCPLARAQRVDLPPKDGYAKLDKVATFKSAPLSEMTEVTLKVSHNLYASTLPCLVGVKAGKDTLEQGLREQGKFLKSLGVPTETISFAGGAGGATADKVTPRATVKLLEAMDKRPEGKVFFEGLPILGVDGTLAEVVPSDSPAKGKARAKTGTLIWSDAMNNRFLLQSKALAGELETKSGDRLFIAMFVNDVPLPRGVSSGREGKILGKLCEIIHEHASPVEAKKLEK